MSEGARKVSELKDASTYTITGVEKERKPFVLTLENLGVRFSKRNLQHLKVINREIALKHHLGNCELSDKQV